MIKLRSLALCGLVACLAQPVWAEIPEAEFAKAFEKFVGTDKGQEAIGTAAKKYFQKLQEENLKQMQAKQDSEMEEQFKNPVKIDVGDAPTKGPATAKVTVIEFSDFQCPYCKRGADTTAQIAKAYPNDVKIAFKHLPLPFHDQAMPAARASWAAQKQGKFWEYHDELFTNQANLGDEFYAKTAEKLGLKMDKFKADMASEESKKAVEADAELAKQHGISGTPGFFVNGVAVKGAYPFEHFKKIIDRWISGPAATAKS